MNPDYEAPVWADNPNAWLYTLQKLKASAEEKGKEFKMNYGAATMIYRAVVKKYTNEELREKVFERFTSACPKCEQNEVMPNDYLCETCRYG